MAIEQLLDRVRPFFQQAFEKAAMGEDLIWDITWTVLPTPAGPEIMYLLYVNCASLDRIGLRLQHQFPIPVSGVGDELIESEVRKNVNLLLNERQKRLTQAQNGQAQLPDNSGPPGGIIMP
jgi:hypothetical protein